MLEGQASEGFALGRDAKGGMGDDAWVMNTAVVQRARIQNFRFKCPVRQSQERAMEQWGVQRQCSGDALVGTHSHHH